MRRITSAFAEAMAAGDLDAAEGWFRLARVTTERTGRTGTVAPAQWAGPADASVIIVG